MLLLDEKRRQEIFTELTADPETTFKILKPLGEGAYGMVFKAQDLRDQQLVALKVMQFDPDDCQDLISEIKILRDCNHTNIVNFKDTFYKDGNIWLAMEFCEGGSALDIIQCAKHTLSERQCQCVLYHALQGLQYLHSKQLIHRDIKAANLLVNKDGRCKIADFGVARAMRASGAGTTIGSPYWMAPEVLGTEKYDNSADIWSLGIAAIEMVIGKPPLANYKPLQAMFMIPKNDPPTLPEEKMDDFSGEFVAFLARCLTKNAAARPTAEQLLRDPFVAAVSQKDAVEKELLPWIRKMLPLIEKERDLQARMANDSCDESKWSDYTASLKRASGDGSTLFGGTMLKNDGGTLNVVRDNAEEVVQHTSRRGQSGTMNSMQVRDEEEEDDDGNNDSSSSSADGDGVDADQGTVRFAAEDLQPAMSHDDDEEVFDGGTMITVKKRGRSSDDDDDSGDSGDDASGDGDDADEDEYHENNFSPSSKDSATQHKFTATETNNNNSLVASPSDTTTNATKSPPQPTPYQLSPKALDITQSGAPELPSPPAEAAASAASSRVGGGYSLDARSFTGGTMVKQTSTDDEEEDPFQGSTMLRAPTIQSSQPPADVISDEDDGNNGGDGDDADDADGDEESLVITVHDRPQKAANRNHNEEDDVTSLDTTKPALSAHTHSDKALKSRYQQYHASSPLDRDNVMSETEDTYELITGYANKPRSPMSKTASVVVTQHPPTHVPPSAELPVSPLSDTPQPKSIKKAHAASAAIASNGGAAGVGNQKRLSKKLRAFNAVVDDDTSPIPQYKHIEMLTGDGNDIIAPHKGSDDDDDEQETLKATFSYITGTTDLHTYNEMVEQLAIIANQLDFTKLMPAMSVADHLLLMVGALATWIQIVSYITIECSDKKRPREIQLFLFATAVSVLFFLVFNPFYVPKFYARYIPRTVQQLFAHTQPAAASANTASGGQIALRIDPNRRRDKNANDDRLENVGARSSTKFIPASTRCKHVLYCMLIWCVRVLALCGALFFAYTIYSDLLQQQYTTRTRFYLVLLSLCTFIGNLPLMGYFMLYFKRTFVVYYVLAFAVVFGAEFAYFHVVRHFTQQYFATFILVNCVFFVFHLMATAWSAYELRHSVLCRIDTNLFPNSNHWRMYFNLDHSLDDNAGSLDSGSADYVQPYRTVSCCCNKLVCDSHALLRFQSWASALSFWSFLGILYTMGFEYVVFASSVFMLVNTIWNPLFYSKEVLHVTTTHACCCSCNKWLFYLMLGVAYLVGFIVNTSWFAFSASAFILSDAHQIEHATLINLVLFLFAAFVFFLPSVGYSFYRIPVTFVAANVAAALFCFLVPICIAFEPHSDGEFDLDNLDAQLLEDWFFVYDFIGAHRSLFVYSNVTFVGLIVCAVVAALYLSCTGLSCVAYRLRKALYMRAKASALLKEFPMNMIMFWSFVLSFAVLTVNSLWVFGDHFGDDSFDSISVIAKTVFVVTVCAQCSSLIYSIFALKQQFDADAMLSAYLFSLTDRVRQTCGFCCFVLLFPIIYLVYLPCIVLLSFCLGITKLLSIRQVHEFWLSFLIADFESSKLASANPAAAAQRPSSQNHGQLQTVNTMSVRSSNHVGISLGEVTLQNQISLGETHHQHPRALMPVNQPSSPHTDFLANNESRRHLHHRMSSSAIQSAHMKLFKCCECCTPQWMSSLYINESVYNNHLMSELIVEALPLLLLNLVNMLFMQNRATIMSLIHAGCCTVYVLYALAKTVYYVRFHEWDLAKFIL